MSGYHPSNSLIRSRVAWLTAGPTHWALTDEIPRRRRAAEGSLNCMFAAMSCDLEVVDAESCWSVVIGSRID